MSDTITIEDDETGKVQAILTRAAAGDTSVLPELRQVLDDNPALWRHLGHLATQAELVWIELVTGNHLVASESLRRYLGAMKQELVGPNPTRVLRLQSEQVAIGWLQVEHANIALANVNLQKDVPLRRWSLRPNGSSSSCADIRNPWRCSRHSSG